MLFGAWALWSRGVAVGSLIVTGSARPARSVGGLKRGAPRLRPARRLSFHRSPASPAPTGGGLIEVHGASSRRRAAHTVEQLDEVEHPHARPVGSELSLHGGRIIPCPARALEPHLGA